MPSPSRGSDDSLMLETMLRASNRAGARARAFGFLSLFTSAGTLICCALPSLLVLIGLGATVASIVSVAPWLVALSQHKDWVFAGSGVLIALNFVYVYGLTPRLRVTHQACPPDATDPACGTAERLTRVVLWISAALYGVGFFSAYVLGWLLAWSET
jgi:mercuric ion transport protein